MTSKCCFLQILALGAILYLPAMAQNSIPSDTTGMRSIGSVAMAKKMIPGWNLGNSLEAIDSWTNPNIKYPCETCWGNAATTKALIDSVKAAGFKSVRIPVAWSRYTDTTKFVIDPQWMNRIQEVVDYVIQSGMIAVLNCHWDGGWLQPTYANQNYGNRRLGAIWRQVGIRFRNYGDRLVFAGTNEVMVDGDYGAPKAEYYTVQNGFLKTFVDTVRATGGRNTYRYLAVQGFNTNITHTINHLVIPSDPTNSKDPTKRLLVEVHYYDPYQFTLESNNPATQWGKGATDKSKTAGWADESWVDSEMTRMKSTYHDKGYGVLFGEYGASHRKALSGHRVYQLAWIAYVTHAIASRGMVPMFWDSGVTDDNASGLFNRGTGAQEHRDVIQVIIDNSEDYGEPLSPYVRARSTQGRAALAPTHRLHNRLWDLNGARLWQ